MTTQTDWQPTASLQALRQRAQLYNEIRQFFAARDVLEVDTPSLSHSTVTDVFIEGFSTTFEHGDRGHNETLYLQTSPEFALKRLLACYQTSVFQMSKAFRHEGFGRWHNPEFTMLEWYRVGLDHHGLMDEISELLAVVLEVEKTERMTYQQAFIQYLDIDPLADTTQRIAEVFNQCEINLSDEYPIDHDGMLQLLFSYQIEPKIGQHWPCFIYDYPASQSSLAKLNANDPRVADRFELYYKGAELANGFNELQNADEQRKRFEHDNRLRRTFRFTEKPVDERFLAALQAGLPACAGVAMGIDRILMLRHGYTHIEQVIAFPVERA
ncbi:elongation factor P--(R)-beta-lysine ligase [Alteromonas lipolytica]|uniref:EF-P lysine aminoacylase GenX n=1 Tax=Alteromonas lipolytica TaxID=1856405 RepID=A0A1E8FFE6_9ALTE|nr:elongation factor P--(R)-beta-lysine ligase [Alteromonas lipolytica]OFI34476.1 EF-P lysine aminoacylase GenX [Alteromonas lipolytica]GGF84863.1 elongation factor P--(R)-beta-lysine ligase [Alteromonas lipolytica]